MEIHLFNNHSFGNIDAYNEFLNSICTGDTEFLSQTMARKYTPVRVIGLLIIAASLVVLGMALLSVFIHVPFEEILWPLGVMSFATGAFIMFDTPDVGLWSR